MNNSVPEGWKSVKLDDVAKETSDRVDNPSKSGHDRFVGLEHLDSGELTVRRWGSTAGLLSAMKLFKRGDILIGRRNAYLKRASKAEFDGVCSGDAYVVREKSGTIAEGLLPIILNSDSFWDYTIAHASGTMSKRAKWRDLAEYSFLLPSLEEQRRIATTLWAAEDCIVKGERFIAAAERAKQVLMRVLFINGIGHTEFQEVKRFGRIPKGWKLVKVKDVISKSQYGISVVGNTEGKYPLLRMNNLVEGKLDTSDLQYVDISSELLENFKLNKGDILFNRTNSYELVGKTSIFDLNNIFVFASYLIRIIPDPGVIIPEYLNYYLNWDKSQKKLRGLCSKGVSQCNINAQILGDFPLSLPPLPEQRQIAAILTRCDETIAAARANVMAAKELKMKLINEMLGTQEN